MMTENNARRPRRRRNLLTRLVRSRVPIRYRIQWRLEGLWLKMPWVPNEGEATAVVVNMCFGGYPMLKDFDTKEDAVNLLASIWNVVDNWDGSRVNVEWAKGGKNVHEWAREIPEGGLA